MSPDTKELLDYLIALISAAGGGGVLLALFGWLKAKAEKPHVAPNPSIGAGALAQIGGMVMGQGDLRDLIDGMRALAAAHDRCTLAREVEMEQAKRLAKERREHEAAIADARHEEWRVAIDVFRTLNDRLRDMRPS